MLAILPIKPFAAAKQRLAGELTPGPRAALVQAMFSDVLVALRRARRVHRVMVVTGDRVAQRVAAGYGAAVLDDDQQGHNPAAGQAIEHALRDGEPAVLLVPGDCPLADPAEIDALIAGQGEHHALIVPDRHGTGTNALLLAPPDVLAPAFGPDSCARHAAAAVAAGAAHRVVTVPTLALDVDTPEDLDALEAAVASRHGGAAHTRGMLRQLGRSRSS
jgi:2-phospho-L-lactate/phosphoenolpyruvate guanylyltransferase